MDDVLEVLQAIHRKLVDIEEIFKIKGVVSKTLADFSKVPKTLNDNTKYVVEYDGETYQYKKSKLCKYCDGHYTAWKQPYAQGDRPISVDFDGNVIEGGCPKYN